MELQQPWTSFASALRPHCRAQYFQDWMHTHGARVPKAAVAMPLSAQAPPQLSARARLCGGGQRHVALRQRGGHARGAGHGQAGGAGLPRAGRGVRARLEGWLGLRHDVLSLLAGGRLGCARLCCDNGLLRCEQHRDRECGAECVCRHVAQRQLALARRSLWLRACRCTPHTVSSVPKTI